MRASICIIFICAVSFTERFNCLKVIDLPMPSQIQEDLERLDRLKSGKGNLTIFSRKSPNVLTNKFISGRKAAKTRIQLELRDRIPSRPKKTLRTSYSEMELKKRGKKADRLMISAMPYPPIRPTTQKFDIRRYFLVGDDGKLKTTNNRQGEYEDEKDANLKTKISTLVEQTIHDTARKIKSVAHIKEKNRNEAPYKAGFILSMIKKSRDMLNELFNVAVKHKDEWKALEQLKIFELIVHTNVDTTNLVRQLVEIHIQHMNTTTPEHPDSSKRRVVLI